MNKGMLVKLMVKDPSTLDEINQYTKAKMYKHVYTKDITSLQSFRRKTFWNSIYLPKVLNSSSFSLSLDLNITKIQKPLLMNSNKHKSNGTKNENEKILIFITITSAVKHAKNTHAVPSQMINFLRAVFRIRLLQFLKLALEDQNKCEKSAKKDASVDKLEGD